ncbi:TIGR04552 family protein [Bdellovibrio sp. HCB337]|uniref:TIGR04552 family protein n=1 Tax=Bdellovibrio sp. HCB337 TaxID=3394358 RepID=UPI0039A658EE
MPQKFKFDLDMLNSVAGGRSAIDSPRLNIKSLEQATSFIESYGFDFSNSHDQEKIWYYHRRALVLIVEKLGFDITEVPELLRERKNLGDIRRLLLLASSKEESERRLQRWSCAILRCMHVYVHAENDLFSSFSEEIQSQILTPFQKAIYHDGTTHKAYLKSQLEEGREPVELLGFEVKPFKTSSSTVIKLLAKPDALAMKIFDKLGVRFVTKSLFDSFQVIRFLVEENIMSFPHIMPDQSSNNLYPVELFVSTCKELMTTGKTYSDDELRQIFDDRLRATGEGAQLFRKENFFSGEDYRFIKFITRKLIHVQTQPGKEPFSFFYPFEVQIMDQSAHQAILSGPSEHEAYKERQRIAARKRLFSE